MSLNTLPLNEKKQSSFRKTKAFWGSTILEKLEYEAKRNTPFLAVFWAWGLQGGTFNRGGAIGSPKSDWVGFCWVNLFGRFTFVLGVKRGNLSSVGKGLLMSVHLHQRIVN